MNSLFTLLPFTIDVWITVAILSVALNGILAVVANKYWRLRNKMDANVDKCEQKLDYLVSRHEVVDEIIAILENITKELNEIIINEKEYKEKFDKIINNFKEKK